MDKPTRRGKQQQSPSWNLLFDETCHGAHIIGFGVMCDRSEAGQPNLRGQQCQLVNIKLQAQNKDGAILGCVTTISSTDYRSIKFNLNHI